MLEAYVSSIARMNRPTTEMNTTKWELKRNEKPLPKFGRCM